MSSNLSSLVNEIDVFPDEDGIWQLDVIRRIKGMIAHRSGFPSVDLDLITRMGMVIVGIRCKGVDQVLHFISRFVFWVE